MTAPPDTPPKSTPQTLAEALVALRAAEDRVHTLEQRLALVQEFSQTGVFERDAASMDGHWDAQMYRIWGLPEREPGAPAPGFAEMSSMVLNEDRRMGVFSDSLAMPGPHMQRMRIRRPDGEVRHLHSQWRVFHDADGRPLRVLGTNTDDTEVFELAQRSELLRSELEVALALGGIALWRADLATGRVHFDERGAAIAGVPFGPDGVDAEAARAGLHPEDLAKVEASAAHTLRTGEPSDMELRYRMPGGGWRHVLSRRALRHDAEGRPAGFVGVLLDVSERVAENRRALESARRLEAAAEAARIGLWSSRLDTPLPSWNQRMYLLFGLDPAQGPLMLDDWLAACVHTDDRARVRSEVVGWWRSGQGEYATEFRVVRPSDGALRWLVVRGSIDASGPAAARRAEGVAIDVTEQQQTLRQLRATVERMQLTTRALGLGTWTASRGHTEVVWDAQMFRLRGIDSPTRRIFNDEIASYVHPEDRDPVMSDQIARAADTSVWRHEFRVCWPGGQVRWISSQSVGVFDENGQPDGRIGVNWDSTEAHLAATAMRDREVAVAESQAKSQAMSRISHELRTPLNAMLGFTQLLRQLGTEGNAAQRALWLEHVEDAGRHLLALIDDVLELSRAEIGELRLAAQPVACAEIMQAALRLVSGTAAQQGVTLRSESQQGVVLADPVRLRQVLINLLSNAIKYNRPGGQVRMWTECRAPRVALHVADNGLGIAPDRLAHAFEPFNRLGAEATGVEGSGIGLAIVKMLVQGMGGEIEVHSQPGQGSDFVVWLPAAPAGAVAAPLVEAEQRVARQPEHRPRPGSARVLYIEDNPVNALLVREMLSHRPQVAVTVADDGASGLVHAREWQPDLILLDMHLPDTDGHAVHRALRSDARTAAIRCVALSANATPGDVEEARVAGFVEYWTKPIDFARFLEGIDRLLADDR